MYKPRNEMGLNSLLAYFLLLLAVDVGSKTVHAERSLNNLSSRRANELGVRYEVDAHLATVRPDPPTLAQPVYVRVLLYWRTTCVAHRQTVCGAHCRRIQCSADLVANWACAALCLWWVPCHILLPPGNFLLMSTF